MQKSIFLFIVAGLLIARTTKAQEMPPVDLPQINQGKDGNPKTDWTKRFFTGGGVGLQFGSYTYIAVSPILGYRFTDNFSGGLGGTYIYLHDKTYNFSTSIYGGKVFAEYDVFRGLAPHVEYEMLNLEVFDNYLGLRRRVNVDSFLIGASYTQPIGEHSGLYIMLLYNLLENIYSPYENPVLRIGFNIGI